MTRWVDDTFNLLTFEDKLTLLAGRDLWHTVAIDHAGVPALKVTDGPRGARGADGNHGPTSTSFPCGTGLGATWSPDLLVEIGDALAHETIAKGAHVLLGPTVNIQRVPNAGRNFECFAEDPLLSGLLAAAWISGLQAAGVGACLKHFVCNDQEHDRYEIDVVVDERTLREVYLEPFRIAVEQAQPWSVMSAYNTVNGVTASEHPLIDEVLRAEFGFDGAVMSDWYGTYGRAAVTSGLDLEMPGPARWMAPEVVTAAVEAGEVTEADIDAKAQRLLTLMDRTRAASRQGGDERAMERPEDRALARRAAVESMVLLTNNGMLPLDRRGRIAVIGELAEITPHQGGGSSSVNPHRAVSVLEGVRSSVGDAAEVTFAAGCEVRKGPSALDPACLVDGGWTVEYFATPEPAGAPVRTVSSARSYLSLFGTGDDWVDYNGFSVRFSATFIARVAGRHEFHVDGAGRLRTRVGTSTVDTWDDTSAEPHVVEAHLDIADEVEVVVEYGTVPSEDTWRYLGLGCREPGPEPSVEGAAAAAADADVAVVVVGLTHEWESEGFDRPDLTLPGDQDMLVSAVLAAQPHTVVVVTAGAPVEMPWVADAGAVVLPWYGGQEVGHAVADVLFGAADPCGRLPVTFPLDSRQHPGLLNYPGSDGRVLYGEGVHVGYRAFDRLGLPPLFPFGHGLSYTSFTANLLDVQRDGRDPLVTIRLTNTGERAGSDVIQVYLRNVGDVDRRLVAFRKVSLGAAEMVTVDVLIPAERLRTWDSDAHRWKGPTGQQTFTVEGNFETLEFTAPEASTP